MNSVYDFLINKVNLKANDIIVVGVSAGPDSMALLYILNELRKEINFKIVVAHVNHNVRVESKEEAEFLKEYCRKHDIVFEMMTITKYGDDNFHNEARTIRYNYYEELIKKYGANYLMTGHHADDLMETILMRIVRGSNLRGYSGFSSFYNMSGYSIVRPLISVTKEELENFDKENNIPYRIDKSNFKDKYTRNRYRKNVLPFLKSEDKHVHLKFLKFSRDLLECDLFIEKMMEKEINNVYHDNFVDINEFKKLDIVLQKRIVDYIFSSIYEDDIILITSCHVGLVMDTINSNKSSLIVNLPNNYLLVKEYDKVYIKHDVDTILPYDIELSDEVFLPNGLVIKKVDKCLTNGNDILRINTSDVTLPLRVRTRRNGDKIGVMNMNGSKKVSEVLINSKIPKSKRDLWPIVVDSTDKVIWIPKVKKSKYNRRKEETCDIIYKCY